MLGVGATVLRPHHDGVMTTQSNKVLINGMEIEQDESSMHTGRSSDHGSEVVNLLMHVSDGEEEENPSFHNQQTEQRTSPFPSSSRGASTSKSVRVDQPSTSSAADSGHFLMPLTTGFLGSAMLSISSSSSLPKPVRRKPGKRRRTHDDRAASLDPGGVKVQGVTSASLDDEPIRSPSVPLAVNTPTEKPLPQKSPLAVQPEVPSSSSTTGGILEQKHSKTKLTHDEKDNETETTPPQLTEETFAVNKTTDVQEKRKPTAAISPKPLSAVAPITSKAPSVPSDELLTSSVSSKELSDKPTSSSEDKLSTTDVTTEPQSNDVAAKTMSPAPLLVTERSLASKAPNKEQPAMPELSTKDSPVVCARTSDEPTTSATSPVSPKAALPVPPVVSPKESSSISPKPSPIAVPAVSPKTPSSVSSHIEDSELPFVIESCKQQPSDIPPSVSDADAAACQSVAVADDRQSISSTEDSRDRLVIDETTGHKDKKGDAVEDDERNATATPSSTTSSTHDSGVSTAKKSKLSNILEALRAGSHHKRTSSGSSPGPAGSRVGASPLPAPDSLTPSSSPFNAATKERKPAVSIVHSDLSPRPLPAPSDPSSTLTRLLATLPNVATALGVNTTTSTSNATSPPLANNHNVSISSSPLAQQRAAVYAAARNMHDPGLSPKRQMAAAMNSHHSASAKTDAKMFAAPPPHVGSNSVQQNAALAAALRAPINPQQHRNVNAAVSPGNDIEIVAEHPRSSSRQNHHPHPPKQQREIDHLENPIEYLLQRPDGCPPYKCRRVSDELARDLGTAYCQDGYACIGCGDTFALRTTLEVHETRRSMLIKCLCTMCRGAMTFYNRCQFISHAKQHMMSPQQAYAKVEIRSLTATETDKALRAWFHSPAFNRCRDMFDLFAFEFGRHVECDDRKETGVIKDNSASIMMMKMLANNPTKSQAQQQQQQQHGPSPPQQQPRPSPTQQQQHRPSPPQQQQHRPSPPQQQQQAQQRQQQHHRPPLPLPQQLQQRLQQPTPPPRTTTAPQMIRQPSPHMQQQQQRMNYAQAQLPELSSEMSRKLSTIQQTPQPPVVVRPPQPSPSAQPASSQSQTLSCSECKANASSPYELRKHFAYNLPGNQKQLICSTQGCSAVFFSQCSMAAHRRTHDASQNSAQTLFVCPECGSQLPNARKLASHLLDHRFAPTALNAWRCARCAMFYSNFGTVLTHATVAHCAHTFNCRTCKAVFKSQSTFLEHARLVHPHLRAQVQNDMQLMRFADTVVQCSDCSFKANTRELVIDHQRKTHYTPDKVKPFQIYRCPMCGRLLENKPGLVSHFERSHKITLSVNDISEQLFSDNKRATT